MNVLAGGLALAIAVAATAGLTLSVLAIIRIPDGYVRVHAVSTAVIVGPVVMLAAAVPTGDGALILRALLAAVFLAATSPIVAHALMRLERRLRADRRDRD